MTDSPTYEQLVAAVQGRVSALSRSLESMAEGDVLLVKAGATNHDQKSVSGRIKTPNGYMRVHYPDRKYATRLHNGDLYVIRLRAEDMK